MWLDVWRLSGLGWRTAMAGAEPEPLPNEVHLLTARQWKTQAGLVRLTFLQKSIE